MSDVERAERDLELAKVSEEYDAAVEAFRKDGSDENKAKKDALAEKVVEMRQASRREREGQAVAGTDGDGNAVAMPQSVESNTEVSQ